MFELQSGVPVAMSLASPALMAALIAALAPALLLAVTLAVLRRPGGMAGHGVGAWAVASLALAIGGAVLIVPAAMTGPRFDLHRELVADVLLVAVLWGLGSGLARFGGRPVRPGLRVFGWLLLVTMAAGFALGGARQVAMLLVQLVALIVAVGQARAAAKFARAVPPPGTGLSALFILVAGLCAALCLAQIGVLLDAVRFDASAWLYPVAFAQPDGADAMLRLCLLIIPGIGLAGTLLLTLSRRRFLRESAAALDPLTGVPLRDGFVAMLDDKIGQAERAREPMVMAMVSVDHFEAISEVYGASGSERVLRHFSGLMRRVLRAQDVPGRVETDTFAIGMPGTAMDTARALTIRLNTEVRATPCPSEPDAIHYTVSVGLVKHAAGESGEALLQRAEDEFGKDATPRPAEPVRATTVRGAGIVLPVRPEAT